MERLRQLWGSVGFQPALLWRTGPRVNQGRPLADDAHYGLGEPKPPDDNDCCKSGCSNCVWLDYAEKLVDLYKDGGVRATEAVARIPDPTVREFVKAELAHIVRDRTES